MKSRSRKKRRLRNKNTARQWVASNGEYLLPAALPVHPHAAKRTKNTAARNLAQVMPINAASVDDDSGDDDDDDGGFRFVVPVASRTPPRIFPAKSARRNRSPSPAVANLISIFLVMWISMLLYLSVQRHRGEHQQQIMKIRKGM